MCWEDIRIGQRTRAISKNVNVAAAGTTLLVSANSTRIALVISSPAVNPMYVHFGTGPVNGQGHKFSIQQRPDAFTIKDHGDMVRVDVYASIPGGAENIEVTEILLLALDPDPKGA